MGRLEKFERKQRVAKMKEVQAAEREIKREKEAEMRKKIQAGIIRYKAWARSRKTKAGRRAAIAAPFMPIVLLLGLSSMSPDPTPRVELEPAQVERIADAKQPSVNATPEPVGEKVTVVKTGLDFQDTYEGERFKQADGSFKVLVKIDEGCPGSGQREYEFVYSPDKSTMEETITDIKSCLGENGVYPQDSMPIEILGDGTVTADSVETDGTIIVDDAIVISALAPKAAGSTDAKLSAQAADEKYKATQAEKQAAEDPKASEDAAIIEKQAAWTAEEQRQAELDAAVQYTEPEYIEPEYVEPQSSYQGGSCASLRNAGLGSDFVPGDANYSADRDQDGDGVACES